MADWISEEDPQLSVADLRARTHALTHGGAGGDERTIVRHRERGKLPVRERIDRLLDPGAPFSSSARWPRTACTTTRHRARES